MKDLNFLENEMQINLDKVWLEFKSSSRFFEIKKFYDWLEKADFYSIRDEGVLIPTTILHPAHWYASQEITKVLYQIAGKNGMYFENVLPGSPNALDSIEADGVEGHVRIFTNNLYQKDMLVTKCETIFFHNHDTFYFTKPPKIRFVK